MIPILLFNKVLFLTVLYTSKPLCSSSRAPSFVEKNKGPACILIGPEGDFSEKERQFIIERKEIFYLSLANNLLRAETAAIAAVTIVNYHLNFN